MKFSIITPTLNSANTIRHTIQSVKVQQGVEVEHIIIDANSTDKTIEVIKSELVDSMIFLSERDKGIYDAINKGILLATGDIIGVLNSDDFYPDEFILSSVMSCFQDGHVNVVYGDLQYVSNDENLEIKRNWIAHDFDLDKLSRGWMPPHPAVFVKKTFHDSIGPYNIAYKISGDYDYLIRLFTNTKLCVSYCNSILVRMRVGGVSNNSIKNIIAKMREDLSVIRRYKIGGLFTLVSKSLRKISQFKV